MWSRSEEEEEEEGGCHIVVPVLWQGRGQHRTQGVHLTVSCYFSPLSAVTLIFFAHLSVSKINVYSSSTDELRSSLDTRRL